MTTRKEFVAGRQLSFNLAKDLPDFYPDGEHAEHGYIYAGCLVIEEVRAHWPEAAKAQGKWHMVIGNCSYFANNMLELQDDLYDYAKREQIV